MEKISLRFNQFNFSTIIRLSIVPALIFNIISGSIFGVFFYLDEESKFQKTKKSISAIIESQSTYFAQEIYLDQRAAFTERVRSINSQLTGLELKTCTVLEIEGQAQGSLGKCDSLLSQVKETFLVPISVDGDKIGTVKVEIYKGALFTPFKKIFLPAFFLSGLIGIIFMWVISKWIYKKAISPLVGELRVSERKAATSILMQMLAHDVRKPFSMLKSGLSLIQNASIKERNELLPMVSNQVNLALAEVNSMIEDVLEIGNNSKLTLTATELREVLKSSLAQVATMFPEKTVKLTYQIEIPHIQSVPEKLSRILTNLITNGIQASTDKEVNLWIKAIESQALPGRVTITIGNSGSYIPKEDRKRLFDQFFTKGKKDGTGLGLAICKKLVNAHGGKIYVSSQKVPMLTEFSFDLAKSNLPVSNQIKKNSLFNSLTEYVLTYDSKDLQEDKISITLDPRIDEYIRTIMIFSQHIGKKLKVALLDDEVIYRSSTKAMTESCEVSNYIEIEEYSNPADILESNLEAIDFLISDVDLKEDLNGYDVVSQIKSRGFEFPVCIHSNKNLPEYYKQSVDIGAKAFIPKPMTLAHLLGFIANNLPESSTTELKPGDKQEEGSQESTTHKKRIIVLDDEVIYLKSWEVSLADSCEVTTYEDTSFLVEDVFSGKIDLSNIEIIICDYYFKNDDVHSNQIGSFLRKKNFKGKLYLSSNGIEKELPDGFDKRIPKEALTIDKLEKL